MTYRITKYNPRNRDEAGRYFVDEWISVSDVGKAFDGRQLTIDTYLLVEDAYVAVVKSALTIAGRGPLRVVDFEDHDNCRHLPDDLVATSEEYRNQFWEGCLVSQENVESCVRLTLREVIWCKLIGKNGFFVHFGYDYYMYIGGIDLNGWDAPPQMFCELCNSPYA